MNTEAICYLLRKTSLTLQDIGKLTPAKFKAILEEVYYQESVDNYIQMQHLASLLAAIYNTIPRKWGNVLTSKDFLQGEEPKRNGNGQLDEEKVTGGIT